MKIGQCIWVRIKYIDGIGIPKRRPYLIVGVNGNKIKVLTVSSTEGKEHKLGFKSNYRLINFKSPFTKDSFVKLDSLQELELDNINYSIGDNGRVLNNYDINEILLRLEEYK